MFQSGAFSSDSIANRCCDSGWKRDAPLAQRLERRLLQLVHRAPPLERDQRLDPALAALAERDRVTVRLALLELPALLAARRARARPASACVRPASSPAASFIRPSAPITVSSGSSCVAADLEVLRVVAGRDLQRARAELGLDALVGDHRHAPLDERHDHLAADRVPVALVVRVHGDGDVGRDRRRPRGRDRDAALAVGERVADVDELVVDVSSWSSSRSESDVWWNGHQLMIRFAR